MSAHMSAHMSAYVSAHVLNDAFRAVIRAKTHIRGRPKRSTPRRRPLARKRPGSGRKQNVRKIGWRRRRRSSGASADKAPAWDEKALKGEGLLIQRSALRLLGSDLFPGLLIHDLHRQADFAALVETEEFHPDLLAFLNHFAYGLGAAGAEL
jgi:hypothetical protein